jgi:Sulfotransferase family
VLSIAEIESDIPDARFVHLVRDPAGVVTSLLRRARDNAGMVGRAHQSNQSNDEAVWRECVHATLERHGKGNHFVVDAESFVDDPERWAVRIAAFLDLPYRSPEHPERVRAAGAAKPSHRPWKADAAGPVQRIAHDAIVLEPLDPRTVDLWAYARQVLGITSGGVSAAVPGASGSGRAEPAQ